MDYSYAVNCVCTLLISFLAGSVPSGYIIGRMNGLDIRNHGSGNIGATNVTRVLGKGWGRICFACDFLKGLLPALAVSLLLKSGSIHDNLGALTLLAAFGAVAGHIWTPFLGFKGGKGIATAAGAVMAVNPPALLVAGVVWAGVFFGTRYVSAASIAAALALPAAGFAFKFLGLWNANAAELALLVILMVIAILKHTSNIKRLLNGTEAGFAKKTDGEDAR